MIFKLTRSQLYKLAAMASFGEDQTLFIDPESQEETGALTVAINVRENAPEHKIEEAHDNGYAYYEINPAGHQTVLGEDEV